VPSRHAVYFVSSENNAADTHPEHTNQQPDYKRTGLHYTQLRAVTCDLLTENKKKCPCEGHQAYKIICLLNAELRELG
jgi:hypothetical protein